MRLLKKNLPILNYRKLGIIEIRSLEVPSVDLIKLIGNPNRIRINILNLRSYMFRIALMI